MPYGKTDIANMALSYIGASRQIVDLLTEDSQEADTCKLWYPAALEALLRAFPWPFATTWADLGLVGDALNHDWAYEYALPSDCVRAIRLTAGGSRTAKGAAFAIGRSSNGGSLALYTDETTPQLQYTSRWDDPARYDGEFADALAWRLAMQIAMPLARNPQLAQAMQAGYRAALEAAGATAANEGEPDAPPAGDFLTVRG